MEDKDKQMRQLLTEPNIYMDITVYHKDGGTNYFYNKQELKGIEVSFKQVEVDGCSTKYTPTDNTNFRIFIYEYKRKNQKKLDQANFFIQTHRDQLFDMYRELDRDSILQLLSTFKDLVK